MRAVGWVAPAFLLSAALPLAAQTLELHSEFLRPTPFGGVVAADAAAQPREFLSPAMVCNGFTTFHVTVESSVSYFLFVGSNPDGVFRTVFYEEEFVQRGQEWIPDRLRPPRTPVFGVIPDPAARIPNQTVRAYLLDVWTPAEARVGRTRLEVQLKAGTWIIWPMEARILGARIPDQRMRSAEPLPGVELRADESAMAPLLSYLGRRGQGPSTGGVVNNTPDAAPRTVREAIRRNAEQDMALARGLDSARLVPALRQRMPQAADGEWYLRIRDLLYRMANGGAAE